VDGGGTNRVGHRPVPGALGGTSEQQGKPAATVAAFLRAEDKSLFLEALVLQQALRAKDRDAVQQALRAIATMPL